MARREQIVDITLGLLARFPLDRVTTRAIAAELGVSQPALFRHFPSRDAIVAAAVETVRADLASVAASVLEAPAPPLERVEALARALSAYATRRPGLPRLLFRDVSGEDREWGTTLRGLQEAQRALVASLVREAVGRGDAPPQVDADRAGALFVAGVQGVFAAWLGRGTGEPDVRGFVAMWRAGVEAGVPAGETIAQVAEVAVDATAILRRGEDPLATVLAASDRVAPGGRLRVDAPFPPARLAALLRAQGWNVELGATGEGHTLTARRPA